VLGAAGALAAGVAGAAALQLAAEGMAGALLTADQACARDAKFCAWYRQQPRAAELPAAVHVKGGPEAVVTITEFSDFECPACAMAYRDLHDVAAAHPERVRVVFHHFPLDAGCNPHVGSRMHPSACLAAVASECAAAAGKFWEYHDRLFDAQDQLGRDALITYATDLGIDAKTFTACLDDPATRAKVRADVDAASNLGVESTPTLFINGRKIPGALDRARYDYAIALEAQP
jgi:protein-disulfide isomerase